MTTRSTGKSQLWIWFVFPSLIIFAIVFFGLSGYLSVRQEMSNELPKNPDNSQKTTPESEKSAANSTTDFFEAEKNFIAQNNSQIFSEPLTFSKKRILLKPFGIKVSPSDSPVSPERFSGYHTGTDFEIFPHELNLEIPVHAICEGKIIFKDRVKGYGNLIVQQCLLENNPVTVIYGHLSFDSKTEITEGELIPQGGFLAFLGKNDSQETDGERKHLHLGIHKGELLALAGYVDNQSLLENWLDYEKLPDSSQQNFD